MIANIILYHFSHHILFCLACSITSYIFQQGNIPKLDIQVNHGSDFMAQIAQWESYPMSLSEFSEESDEKKVQALTLCFTCETLSIVHNLGIADT